MGFCNDNDRVKGGQGCVCQWSNMYTMYWFNISGDIGQYGNQLYGMSHGG